MESRSLHTLISEITADLDAEVTAWRTRDRSMPCGRLFTSTESLCMCVEPTDVSRSTRFTWPLGVNGSKGYKELLGLWLSENEGAKFWLSCLTDLKNRGLNVTSS